MTALPQSLCPRSTIRWDAVRLAFCGWARLRVHDSRDPVCAGAGQKCAPVCRSLLWRQQRPFSGRLDTAVVTQRRLFHWRKRVPPPAFLIVNLENAGVEEADHAAWCYGSHVLDDGEGRQ